MSATAERLRVGHRVRVLITTGQGARVEIAKILDRDRKHGRVIYILNNGHWYYREQILGRAK